MGFLEWKFERATPERERGEWELGGEGKGGAAPKKSQEREVSMRVRLRVSLYCRVCMLLPSYTSNHIGPI